VDRAPRPRSRLRRAVSTVAGLVRGHTLPELVDLVRVRSESAASRTERFRRARLEGAGRLVFVCYGNIMRSAFATALARRVCREEGRCHDAECGGRIVGAGTHARDGRGAQEEAIVAARRLHVSLEAHRASSLGAIAPCSRDVFVCMDWSNVVVVRRWPGVNPRRVFLIGDLEEAGPGGRVVEDPYGQGVEEAVDRFRVIGSLVPRWTRLLDAPGEPPPA
jgi:protein-tyrosine-phosphatase